jgi:hypothetical protein
MNTANPFIQMAGTLGSMNPFAKMATSLTTRSLPDWVQTEENGKPLSRTETIRRHLRETGTAMTSEEIAFDLDDALLSPAKQSAPDRIWGWQDSQLSIARHYGGCDYNGQRYVIDEATEGQPLVRLDVIARENKAKALAAKLTRAQAQAEATATQGALL